ncbi:hypothetical protein P170DRAFT_512833 [Aspergillus steynii IBT 23096]|uniref:LDB19 N-terminal domain-containing protein n=1 Tax=Aspergillus steynii IBT 23096 TaxID=1392250 RepID=A0A2I2G0B2_9EURO|nr:uncharacterized protein P170DRAFT_512833 [Aspergillus steynii IBT 23096]PLB46309.1 hypothetical protein P170DRAFT_512833 [Aspergillus steynii IBT 23096]
MGILDVQLTAPDTHLILVEGHGECYAPPIVGSVAITVPTPSAQSPDDYTVNIGLTRAVGLKKQQPASFPDKNDILLQRLLRRRSFRKQPHHPCEPAVCANVKTLMQCNLWHAPEKIEHNQDYGTTTLKFTFAIPLPISLPATTETMLGNISYAIKATVSSASRKLIDTIRPIRIQRRLVPQQAETLCQLRGFSGENFTTELRITPQESLDPSLKGAYSVELAAYRTVTQGVRKTEVKHVVIKELKWRVEETIKGPYLSSQEDNGDAGIHRQSQHARQLCEGRRTGNWKAMNCLSGATEKGDRIVIPFEVIIPRSADATDELENCEEAAGLTVKHQLRLDMVTGEDTFDQATGRLVDRRPRTKSFVAFFALPILEFASRNDVACATFPASNLPKYEESAEPPNYDVVR